MKAEHTFKTNLLLSNTDDLATLLKRLALFFDQIGIILPTFATLKVDMTIDPKRIKDIGGGKKGIVDFNYFQDVQRSIQLSMDHVQLILKDTESEETLSALLEQKIVQEVGEDIFDEEQKRNVKQLRDLLIKLDIDDKEFNKLSGTKKKDYNIVKFSPYWMLLLDGKEKGKAVFQSQYNGKNKGIPLYQFKEPGTIKDSYNLTTCLILSDLTNAYPIFPSSIHRNELEYRYTQYIQGLKVFRELTNETLILPDSDMVFGEIGYQLANAVFTSDLIKRKSITDILKYRHALNESRIKFLSHNIGELSQLIEGNPWSEKTTQEIRKYIKGKLYQDLLAHEEKSKQIWEKLFGSLTVNLASVVRSVAAGSAGAGIIGSVIPGTTLWGLLAIGALAGAIKEVPKIVDNLVKHILEIRKHKCSSIAYIANFR